MLIISPVLCWHILNVRYVPHNKYVVKRDMPLQQSTVPNCQWLHQPFDNIFITTQYRQMSPDPIPMKPEEALVDWWQLRETKGFDSDT